jgi:hypothetical protein
MTPATSPAPRSPRRCSVFRSSMAWTSWSKARSRALKTVNRELIALAGVGRNSRTIGSTVVGLAIAGGSIAASGPATAAPTASAAADRPADPRPQPGPGPGRRRHALTTRPPLQVRAGAPCGGAPKGAVNAAEPPRELCRSCRRLAALGALQIFQQPPDWQKLERVKGIEPSS